jgi:hypothetical protein
MVLLINMMDDGRSSEVMFSTCPFDGILVGCWCVVVIHNGLR